MRGISPKVIVEINQTANLFQSSVYIYTNNKVIDAKSILGLSITLLSNKVFELEIIGSDQTAAQTAMKKVFEKHQLNCKLK